MNRTNKLKLDIREPEVNYKPIGVESLVKRTDCMGDLLHTKT